MPQQVLGQLPEKLLEPVPRLFVQPVDAKACHPLVSAQADGRDLLCHPPSKARLAGPGQPA
jgi:hypothetical protein